MRLLMYSPRRTMTKISVTKHAGKNFIVMNFFMISELSTCFKSLTTYIALKKKVFFKSHKFSPSKFSLHQKKTAGLPQNFDQYYVFLYEYLNLLFVKNNDHIRHTEQQKNK